MKYSASFFLIVIGIVCLLLFKKWGSPNKEGFVNNCAAGKYSTLNGACTNCLAGTTSIGGSSRSCTNCAAGTSSTAGGSCTNCAAGKSSAEGGSCTNCVAGTYSAAGGACTPCEPGKYSAAGASTCTACAAGKTSPERSTSIAACVCAAGTYLYGSTCINCPAGKSSAAGGACTDCGTGTYSVAGGACTVDAYNTRNGIITVGKVYMLKDVSYSYVALDKLGNIYTSSGTTLTMIAGSRINPYPSFLTDASGILIPNNETSGNPTALTVGTTYYLNIGERKTSSGNIIGTTQFADNISASSLRIIGAISTIEFDNLNNIYISDNTNQVTRYGSVIYKINSSGNVNIVAGNKNITMSSDIPIASTLSTALSFNFSTNISIKIDIYNNIYVLDMNLYTLFFIPSGTANPFPNIISGTLIAGNIYKLIEYDSTYNYTVPTNGDGGLARNAKLSLNVMCFSVDSSLNIYIADKYLIRMICGPNTTSSPFKCYDTTSTSTTTPRTVITSLTPGYIYRIAGTGVGTGSDNNGGSDIDAITATFGNVKSLFIDYQGNLQIFETSTYLIRMISSRNNTSSYPVYPRQIGQSRATTPTNTIRSNYIYTIVGGGVAGTANNPTSFFSPDIYNVNIYPMNGGIDIFGNYYINNGKMDNIYTKSGLYKAVINTLACESPLPTGVASCKASDINTPGSLICTDGYANPSGTACITCEAGFYCTKTETGNLKIPCAQGTYNSLTGQNSSTACLSCSAGAYSLGGAASCSTCAAGTSSDGTSICSACAAGKYSIAGQSCSDCPQGTYNSLTGQASCLNCPASTYNINTGSISSEACLSCPVGSYCPIGSANGALCPQGTYNSNTGQAICSNCPAGSYNSNTGSISSNACIACQTGFYALAGASQCTPCANNAYSCTPTSLICNSNYYDNGSGACTACPTDSTCAIGGGCNATSLTAFECSGGYSRIGLNCSKTQYSSNLPNHTRGTNQQMNDSMPYFYGTEPTDYNTAGCDTTNSCQYNWSGSIGPASSNPCPAKNSWYDWGQQKCVDDLGKPVDEMNPCGSNTVYDLKTNACLTVQKAFASQPPNTIGLPSLTSPGDFSNCRTVDQGDCTPYYVNGTTTTTINPCTGLSKYNFLSRSCTMTEAAIQTSNCCGLEANTLATTPGCSNLVNSSPSYTIIAEMCPSGTNDICCGAARQASATCIKRGPYWTASPGYAKNYSYNTLCSAGFQDYDNAIDTMATKRLEWLQRRQRINA